MAKKNTQTKPKADPSIEDVSALLDIGTHARQYGQTAADIETISTLRALQVRLGISSKDKKKDIINEIRHLIPSLSVEDAETTAEAISNIPVNNIPEELNDTIADFLCDENRTIVVTSFKKQFLITTASLAIAILAYIILKPILYPPKWIATYFPNKDLSAPMYGFFEEEWPEYNWGLEAPKPGMSANNFSVRWESNLSLDKDATIRFETISDDGVRLYVDNQLVMNYWIPQDSITRVKLLSLKAGTHKVRLEYFEAENGARIDFKAIPQDNTVNLEFSKP